MLPNVLLARDLSLEGKRILIRTDFNVPIKDGVILDNDRILQALPTIQYVLDQKAHTVIIISHLGKPDGKMIEEYSLAPIAAYLQILLPKQRVRFLNDCIGEDVKRTCYDSNEGDVLLLENLKFHVEEEGYRPKDEQGRRAKEDEDSIKMFRSSLSQLADIYINDAFRISNKTYSSIVGIQLEQKAAGLLMQKELESLCKMMETPERPFIAILGGAKVSDKIQLIEKMLDKVNVLILCGGLSFTFLKTCNNMKIGNSLYDSRSDCEELATSLMNRAKEKNVKMVLPIDFVTASDFNKIPSVLGYSTDHIPDDMMGLDCGQKSCQLFHDEILNCKTVFWNGSPGVFEFEDNFSKGTKAILNSIIQATEKGATSIIGGGDTAAIATRWASRSQFSHVSTGGNASLEFLEGKELVGVSSLTIKP
ncbi:3-phosphoglycerate kinase [Mucor mucedo]|uniref:3-phosphoglycerate kinase n=1 Tax=Mucor mucedo TaxID=29922 RepID=UPI00221FC673|nr:3-phosphoglycerate kinase [Mucor mucedo]KAI7890079.1 3-phosphoglycerate kinase [Mucor mucedo]